MLLKKIRNQASNPEGHLNQNQIQQALEALQKKLLLDQVVTMKASIIKNQLAQQPLFIPPLVSQPNPFSLPLNNTNGQEDNEFFNNNGEGPKVIYGSVEYPLLSMTTPLFGSDTAQKGSLLNFSDCFAKKSDGFIVESLCVTRAETQRSESDEVIEELSQAMEGKKKKANKTNAKSAAEKGKKTQKKEKKQTKSKAKENKQIKDDSFLSEISLTP